MTAMTASGYSFPLFSSLLKKEGIEEKENKFVKPALYFF